MNIIWLASYPRSGNTLLRTILWHCFALRSASIYNNEIDASGGGRELEELVGHIEHEPKGSIRFPPYSIPLVKTHEHPANENPAIYVVRDGRAASVSLWKYYRGNLPLDAVIEGRHRFGTWSSHVYAWSPDKRPHTLLLRYEDMVNDLPMIVQRISVFLKRDIVNNNIPSRDEIANIGGRLVKKKSDWRTEISEELMDRFTELNGEMLKRMGYL